MSDTKESRDEKKKKQKPEVEESQQELESILGQITEKGEGDISRKPEEEKEKKESTDDRVRSLREPEPEGLEGILESITEKPQEEPVEELNAIQKIIGVFTDPEKVFRYLKMKPDFVIPLILAILVSILSGQLLYDIAINDQIQSFEQNDQIPADRRDLIIEQLEASKSGKRKMINTLVIPPIALVVIYAIISLVFLFAGNILLGGKARFKQLFSVYSYSNLIIVVLGTLVKIPLILSKQTTKVDLSPAVFTDASQIGTALHNFISSFDLFTLWFLFVFGWGFSVIYGFSKLKGIVSVILAWLLYVVIFKVWLSSVFQGLVG